MPIWQRTFDSRRRHCWELKDGRRVLDGVIYPDQTCTVDHSADPKVVDKVEWMRFIHAVGRLMDSGNPFLPTDDGGHLDVTSVPGTESYFGPDSLRVEVVHHRDDSAGNDRSFVTIKLYDDSLVSIFDAALVAVEESYKVEVK
jgi:hypothetical protein